MSWARATASRERSNACAIASCNTPSRTPVRRSEKMIFAAYVAKIIFSDLRTGVREGVLHDAIAQAFDRSRDAVARAQLMTGDLSEVALLARRDQLETAQFKLFHPIQFMLAS